MVEVHGQGFTVTRAPSECVRRRRGFVLKRRNGRIKQVIVRVGEVNGPRGEIDKHRRIQVDLVAARAAMVEEVGGHLYASIDRVAHAVGKHLDRTFALRDAKRQGARPASNRYQTQQPAADHRARA